jgi:hypothetical protein
MESVARNPGPSSGLILSDRENDGGHNGDRDKLDGSALEQSLVHAADALVHVRNAAFHLVEPPP